MWGPGGPPRQDGAVFGLDGDHAHVGLARFQHLADAGQGTAGADAGDHDIDLAAGVVPDFFRRGLAMDFRVRRVFELLWHKRIGRVGDDLFGAGDRSVDALGGRCQNQLSAQENQHLAALVRHRIRHHQNTAVAARGGDEGQRDAGIARGRLDDDAARPYFAVGLGG